MKKIKPSIKIAAGFALLVASAYGGSKVYTKWALQSVPFDAIKPDKITLLGLDKEAGVRIIVANRVAQVVDGGNGSFAGDSGSGSEGVTEGAFKKRIPMKELLGILGGDGNSVGRFVMIMNDKKEDDSWPTERIVWKSEDIQKAIDGDPALRAKLENNLNCKLDGTPLPQLSLSAFYNGIIIDKPVTVETREGTSVQRVTGRIQEPFKPRFIAEMNKALEEVNVTEQRLASEYAARVKAITEGDPVTGKLAKKDDLTDVLKSLIAPSKNTILVENADKILRHAHVILNSSMVESAESIPGEGNQKGKYTLKIRLNEEGRKRLWKFSADRIGAPLLFIANGVPIAAPQIKHELSQGELVITQLEDEALIEEAIALVKNK